MRSFATLSIFYFLSTLALATTSKVASNTKSSAPSSAHATGNATVPVHGQTLATSSNGTVVADLEVSGTAPLNKIATEVGLKFAHAPAGHLRHPIAGLKIQNQKTLKAVMAIEYHSIQAKYHKTTGIDVDLIPSGSGSHLPGGNVNLLKKFKALNKASVDNPDSISKNVTIAGTCGEYNVRVIEYQNTHNDSVKFTLPLVSVTIVC